MTQLYLTAAENGTTPECIFLNLLIWTSLWFWDSHLWLWKHWVVSVERIHVGSMTAALGNCSLEVPVSLRERRREHCCSSHSCPSWKFKVGQGEFRLLCFCSSSVKWDNMVFFFPADQPKNKFLFWCHELVITWKLNLSYFYFKMVLLLMGH